MLMYWSTTTSAPTIHAYIKRILVPNTASVWCFPRNAYTLYDRNLVVGRTQRRRGWTDSLPRSVVESECDCRTHKKFIPIQQSKPRESSKAASAVRVRVCGSENGNFCLIIEWISGKRKNCWRLRELRAYGSFPEINRRKLRREESQPYHTSVFRQRTRWAQSLRCDGDWEMCKFLIAGKSRPNSSESGRARNTPA